MLYTDLASTQLVSWNILTKYHVNPLAAFNKAKLDPSLMYRANARYSIAEIQSLWREMEILIPDPSFALSTATCWHPSYLGTLGHSLLMAPSLRASLEMLNKYSRLVSEIFFGMLSENKSRKTVTFVILPRSPLARLDSQEDSAVALSLIHI